MAELQKFIPFTKVDSVRREVSGIVTAEQPDKDLEVCDYAKSKPFYEAWSSEFKKATDGASLGNLREMHQLKAVGKAIDLQFNDPDKEVIMTFRVTDDDAWKKCEERVYTGFSQGGRKVGDQVPDPVHKGCVRYVANPSEVSLVDNPCLPEAHFAYVKADGAVEMRKFLKTEAPNVQRIASLEQEVALLKAASAGAPKVADPAPELSKEAKTKRVAGKDLHASDFAYVGDPEKTETWKLPIHDKAHARNALARFNQTQGIPSSEKAKVRSKVVSAAKKFGVDVASEQAKTAAIGAAVRKAARIYINRNYQKIVSPRLMNLDADLGKLRKGMYEVSRMASFMDGLQNLLLSVTFEQEWEGDDDSKLPEMLAENIEELSTTFLALVDEETRELVEEVQARAKV